MQEGSTDTPPAERRSRSGSSRSAALPPREGSRHASSVGSPAPHYVGSPLAIPTHTCGAERSTPKRKRGSGGTEAAGIPVAKLPERGAASQAGHKPPDGPSAPFPAPGAGARTEASSPLGAARGGQAAARHAGTAGRRLGGSHKGLAEPPAPGSSGQAKRFPEAEVPGGSFCGASPRPELR